MKNSTLNKIALTGALGLATLMALPALAAENGDVEKCRAAFSQQGDLNMDDYRLRFERQDGRRTKVLYFKAIPHSGGDTLDVTCTLRHTQVLAVNPGSGEVTLVASN